MKLISLVFLFAITLCNLPEVQATTKLVVKSQSTSKFAISPLILSSGKDEQKNDTRAERRQRKR